MQPEVLPSSPLVASSSTGSSPIAAISARAHHKVRAPSTSSKPKAQVSSVYLRVLGYSAYHHVNKRAGRSSEVQDMSLPRRPTCRLAAKWMIIQEDSSQANPSRGCLRAPATQNAKAISLAGPAHLHNLDRIVSSPFPSLGHLTHFMLILEFCTLKSVQ
ncbi:hypothetical protein AMTR_s00066p00029900 [Amborella trichopoda]|uniref:Uncharacterized protein n=1 Tax=Amborella trichopoda TaxID=13333 RepID=U5D3D4_AMBTC|nr:hypothetical protein AMTR_s00066p00029900 [Amborella trichopoda]